MIPIKSNKIINLFGKSVLGVNLFLIILIRNWKDKYIIRHEVTHSIQMFVTFIIPYVIIYICNQIYNKKVKYKHIKNKDRKNYLSYRNVIFERHAFEEENRKGLINPFGWVKYIKDIKKKN